MWLLQGERLGDPRLLQVCVYFTHQQNGGGFLLKGLIKLAHKQEYFSTLDARATRKQTFFPFSSMSGANPSPQQRRGSRPLSGSIGPGRSRSPAWLRMFTPGVVLVTMSGRSSAFLLYL